MLNYYECECCRRKVEYRTKCIVPTLRKTIYSILWHFSISSSKVFSNRFEDVESLSRRILRGEKKFHLLESSYKEICKSYGFLRPIKNRTFRFIIKLIGNLNLNGNRHETEKSKNSW